MANDELPTRLPCVDYHAPVPFARSAEGPEYRDGRLGESRDQLVTGVAAALVMVIDPGSLVAVIGFFALIPFHLATGWKLNRLSRSSSLTV